MMSWNVLEERTSGGIIVIRLLDGAGSQQPVGKVEVRLLGQKESAIRTPSGYYIFTNLPSGHYEVEVKSEYYFPAKKELEAVVLPPEGQALPSEAEKLKLEAAEMELIPNAAYPFTAGTTLLQAQVRDTTKKPISGASVEVLQLLSEPRIVGSMKEIIGRKLFMKTLEEPLQPGDHLESQGEILQITAPLPQHFKQQPFYLAKEPGQSIIDDSLVSLTQTIWKTQTDEKGQWVIAIPHIRDAPLLLTIRKDNFKDYSEEVTLIEGQANSRGIIELNRV